VRRCGENDDGSEVACQGVVRQLREAHDVLHVREVRQDDGDGLDVASGLDELAHGSEGVREFTGLVDEGVLQSQPSRCACSTRVQRTSMTRTTR
jgi:hypothetical protein